jgi:hypothetical protein
MNTKLPYLTLAALVLIAFTARAGDDYAWGATTGSSIVKLDATTGQLQPLTYNSISYTNFPLINAATLHNLTPLWIAENPNGTLYGMDNSGNFYSIATVLSLDANNNIGLAATSLGTISGVGDVRGAVWISATALDISWGGTNLSQYNLTTKTTTSLGSYSNSNFTPNIGGLAFNGLLYGVQFSPSPNAVDLISVVKATNVATPASFNAGGTAPAFFGASLLYFSDGNSNFYSYNFANSTVSGPTSYNSLNGVHSLTPLVVSGGSGTPTPTPTATPTPTPTATPTPSPTATPKITYTMPTGAMTVTAPETTPSGSPECAPGYNYSASESSLFAAGATIDPNGTLGIYRYYQTTTNGTSYLPLTATAANPASTVWAWPSGSTNNHAAISYMAGQINSVAGLDFYYGRETLTLVYTSPGNGTTKVLDTKTIYQYPWNYNSSQTYSPTALFTNAITNVQTASNPYPYPTPTPAALVFQGDPPRFTVQMNDLYPNGVTSVIIYPGTPASNPTATGFATIAVTSATTPNSGLYTNASPATFEVQSYINTSVTTAQTYTIAAIQTLPSVYAASTTNPSILNTLTFTTTSGFNVNGTVGTVK